MSTLTWASYEVADKTHPYPREKLVDREELVRLIRESGVRICGNCHQNDSEGAPIVEVSGRTYPVEVRYRDLDEETDQVQGIIEAVDELGQEGNGDVLVFLSGEREIHDTADALRRHDSRL